MAFAITAGRATNTDRIAAAGTALGGVLPQGSAVVYDDVNEASDRTAREEAAFRPVDLGEMLGAGAVKELGLLDVRRRP